jgi:hypothetical protein
MSGKSVHTLILTVTAVIGLGSITLGTSVLDRLVFRTTPTYSDAVPDASSADVPRYVHPAPTRLADDIWSFEFD